MTLRASPLSRTHSLLARIHFRNGYFHGIGTWQERDIWKQAGFKWSPVRKAWITDQQHVAESVQGVEWTPAAMAYIAERTRVLEESYDLSFANDTDFMVPVPDGIHPRTGKPFEFFPYQRAGVEYAMQRKDTLIADQPGLGKSPMGVGVFNADPKARRCLVIAPASLKEHWRREFELWKTKDVTVGIAETNVDVKEQIGVFKSGKKKGQPRYKTVDTIKEFWPDTDVVIINYDILSRFHDQIKSVAWDLLIADEAHALKTVDSGRTLFILGGKKKDKTTGWKPVWYSAIEANRRVFLTGTPMMNRPVELWPFIKAFDPSGKARNPDPNKPDSAFEQYGYRYCDGYWDMTLGGYDKNGRKKGDYNFSGASNQEELGEYLRSTFMIRRLKKEVLPELPDKTRQIIVLDSPEIRQAVAREDELATELRLYESMLRQVDDITSEHEADRILREAEEGRMIAERAAAMGFEAATFDPDAPNTRALNMDYAKAVTGLEPPAIAILFEEMAAARRELGMAKLSAGVPWLKSFLDGGEKLVCFGYHTDVLKALQEQLAPYDPMLIYGGVPAPKRQGRVDHFQEQESCRIIFLQHDSGGVGYTLTRAKDCAFFEGDWVPTKLEQDFDRICRIGQTADKLMGFFLTANGSLDAKMAQRAWEKEGNITSVLDTRRARMPV